MHVCAQLEHMMYTWQTYLASDCADVQESLARQVPSSCLSGAVSYCDMDPGLDSESASLKEDVSGVLSGL